MFVLFLECYHPVMRVVNVAGAGMAAPQRGLKTGNDVMPLSHEEPLSHAIRASQPRHCYSHLKVRLDSSASHGSHTSA
jgi:hypothetical protein